MCGSCCTGALGGGEDASEFADGSLRFCRVEPPLEFVMAVLTTLLSVWCATSRFNHEVVAFRFSGEGRADRHAQYLKCYVFWSWAHYRLFYGVRRRRRGLLLAAGKPGRLCCAKGCGRG